MENNKHLPQLDGYRALAILPVMGIHLWQAPEGYPLLTRLFNGGWIGVDLFFALSGYLITGILLRSRNDPHYYRNFYTRRSLRIFPLFFAFLFVTLAVRPLISPDPGLLQAARDWPWYVFYGANILAALVGWQSIVGVTWSLAIEEQFYLVWPTVVKWLSADRLKLACIGLILLSPLLRGILFPLLGWRWCFVATPLRGDAFAWGALIALADPASLKRLAWPALLVSIAVIVPTLAMGLFDRTTLWVSSVGYTLTGMGSAAGLYLALQAKSSLLAASPMRYIGKISYGIYLLHGSVAIEVSRRFHPTGLLGSLEFMLVAGAIAIGVASVSFYFFETPFLKLKDRLAAPRPPIGTPRLVASES